jgi:signal transduction histidine kinase
LDRHLELVQGASNLLGVALPNVRPGVKRAGRTNGDAGVAGFGRPADAAAERIHSLLQDPLAEVAHTLRSPLTAIKGYSTSLLQPGLTWPPEVQREFLKTIARASDQLDRALQDLLEPRSRRQTPTPRQQALPAPAELQDAAG